MNMDNLIEESNRQPKAPQPKKEGILTRFNKWREVRAGQQRMRVEKAKKDRYAANLEMIKEEKQGLELDRLRYQRAKYQPKQPMNNRLSRSINPNFMSDFGSQNSNFISNMTSGSGGGFSFGNTQKPKKKPSSNENDWLMKIAGMK